MLNVALQFSSIPSFIISFLANKNMYKLSTSHNKAITYIMPECLNVEALKPSLFSCLIVTLCRVIALNKHCNIDFVVFLLFFYFCFSLLFQNTKNFVWFALSALITITLTLSQFFSYLKRMLFNAMTNYFIFKIVR